MIYESEEGLIESAIPRKAKYFVLTIFLAISFCILFVSYHFLIGPFYFSVEANKVYGGVLINIVEGESAKDVGAELQSKGIISSSVLFNATVGVFGFAKHIVPGVYLFRKPQGILFAESRISRGDFGIARLKITFPEGFTTKQVADRLEANLPFFDKDLFLSLASTSEGYLFPSTYFFAPGASEGEIFGVLVNTFSKMTKLIFANSARDKEDVIKMASIIEKEVRDPKDMQIVSGILWKRLSIGMALQVDSAPITYEERGLPEEPICNPGLNAIKAAIAPEASLHLYFLTDKAGKVYYAKTFEEHKRNKTKYLNK